MHGIHGLGLMSFTLAVAQQQPLLTHDNGAQDGSCGSFPLSCHNSSVVDNLCCFNSPGGTLLLTQFWDTSPPTGPEDSWTLHGLWPDNCDGTYEANCDDSRSYRNITAILEQFGRTETLRFMQQYWKDYKGNDESFWQHEWGKHGTCVSTLNPSCFSSYTPTSEVPAFFDRAVELFKSLPSYEWLTTAGIVPSSTARYTAAQIQDALSKHFDGHEIRLGCHNGALNELWYFYNVRGSVQDGEFISTDMIGSHSTCPRTGIRWLPKGNSPAPAPTQTHTRTAIPEPTSKPTPGQPFNGRGQINVITSGNKKGCVISGGTWYVSGTCATFVATKDDDEFTLKSSQGPCGIVENKLVCGRAIKASRFEAADSRLLFNGTDTFYADETPNGRTKSQIYIDSDHNLSIQLQWEQ